MRRIVAMLVAALLVLTVAGCGKKTEEPKQVGGEMGAPGMGMPPMGGAGGGEAPAGMPPAMGGEGSGMPPGMGMGAKATAPKQVVAPESVKKMWPAVKIMVKKKNSSEEGKIYEVAAGKTIEVPGSKLKVEVGQYLPDFFMDGQSITSKSDVQINPTVRLTIFEGDKEIYKGWAFEKYPDAHSFTHPEYTVTLVGGVKAK